MTTNACWSPGSLFLLATLWAVPAGCEGCSQPETEGPATAASTKAPKTASQPEPRPEPIPPPDLQIQVRVGEQGTLQPIVSNHDAEAVRLSPIVSVQRATNGDWQTLQDRRAALRLACDSGVPECFTLVPGAELHLPAWTPQDGRCGCEPCTPLKSGRYRLMLRGCEDRYRAFSDAFEIDVP